MSDLARPEWQKGLPVGLLDWLERDSHYTLAGVKTVAAYSDQSGRSYNIRVVFNNGYSDTMQIDRSSFLSNPLIEGYNDIFPQNVWLDRLIMGRRLRLPLSYYNWSADAPNYALPQNAQKIYLKIFKRPDDDPFLFSFAFRLLNDPRLLPEEIVPVFRMMLLFADWKPRQICTAAYHAYCSEIATRGSVPDCH